LIWLFKPGVRTFTQADANSRRFVMETNNSSTSNINGATGNGVSVSVKATTTAAATPTTPVTVSPGKAKVAVGFLSRDTDAQLGTDTGRIVTSMTGNVAFATPNPTVANLSTALNAFLVAVTAAHDSKIARTQRDQQRANLCALIRELAHYVDVTSAGDLPVLLSSGFPAHRTAARIGLLPAPQNMRLVRGKVSGQAIARCRKLPQATAYQWRCAPVATPTGWLPVVTTASAHYLFEELLPLTAYLAQVCVVGTAGNSDWSEAATVIVL
jgi:hypothetical protein